MSNFSGSSETARLMKNLGVLVKMNYTCDASGATMSDANNGFHTLGYNTNYVTYNITSNSQPLRAMAHN
ncbi:MAG: Peptidase family [Sphingobacteriales bacterium]|nr:Peptidase family [Sphingobacteriales bacterium]